MKIFFSLKAIKTLFILIAILSFTKSVIYETIRLNKDFNKIYSYEKNFFVTYDEDYSTNYIKLEVELLYYNNEIAFPIIIKILILRKENNCLTTFQIQLLCG